MTQFLDIRRNLIYPSALFCNKQKPERANTIDLVMLSNHPGAMIVDQERICGKLLVESHGFDFTTSKTSGCKHPLRSIHFYSSPRQKRSEGVGLWFFT